MNRDLLFRIGYTVRPDSGPMLKQLASEVQSTMREIEQSIGRVGAAAATARDSASRTSTMPFPRFSGGGSYEDQLNRLRGTTTDQLVGPTFTVPPSGPSAPSAPSTPRVPGGSTPKPSRAPSAPADDAIDHGAIYDSNIKKIDEYDEKSKQLTRNLKTNFREAAERIEGGSSALAQFASGLAFLTAGNQDMEKFIKTLATIKGVSDIGVGAIKMFTNLSQIITVVKDRQAMHNEQQEIAAKKAQSVATAVRAQSALVEAGGNALRDANRRNREHAESLDQVAMAAQRAAAAERDYDAAVGQTSPVGPGARVAGAGGGRFGRAGGFLASAGSAIGGSALSSVVGGGLLSTIGGIGIDAIMGRMFTGGAAAAAGSGGGAAAGAGAAAAGGAAGGAASGGLALGALATTAAAATAALGAIALVAVEVSETFKGTATQAGSVTDTIASWEVRIVDWIGDMTGFFDVVGGTKEAAKADKALEDRKKKNALDAISNQASGEMAVSRRDLATKSFNADMAGTRTIEKFNAESGYGTLAGLGFRRDNLRSEIEREKQYSSLNGGDNTAAGKRQRAESEERLEKMRRELSSVDSLTAGTMAAGGEDQEANIAKRKVEYAENLKTVMDDIAKMEADGVKEEQNYVNALARAKELSDGLVSIEEESLQLIRSQKEERARANQESIDQLTRRIELTRQEGMAAENALKSGAERFASMNGADQAAALNAMKRAEAGGTESLSDRERGLLRSIGTQKAVEAAEKADRAEAEKGGFFKTFGKEEAAKVAAAGEQVQQMKVELQNKVDLGVQVEVDYRKLASEAANAVRAELERGLAVFRKEINEQFRQTSRDQAAKFQESYAKQRAVNKSS